MLHLDGFRFRFDGGQEWKLRFTWAGLFALYEEWGDAFEVRVGTALNGKVAGLQDLAALTEAAGGPPRAEVIAASPPIDELRISLTVCWNWTHQGHESARRFAAAVAADKKAAAEAAKTPEKKWSRFLSMFGFNRPSMEPSAPE